MAEEIKEDPVKEDPVKEDPVKEDLIVMTEIIKEDPIKEDPVKEDPVKGKAFNLYDKMEDYITSMFSVFKMINKRPEIKRNTKYQMISLVILNYVTFMAKEQHISLRDIVEQETVNLIPIFEYIAVNNIELLDFSTINMTHIDITNKLDIEKYVLTHVYYITQKPI